jgi:tether containing UBX domain for GLUT4
MGGTGGKESLNDLGLVPQSVLMVKWEDEAMNGEPSPSFLGIRGEANDSNWISCAVKG